MILRSHINRLRKWTKKKKKMNHLKLLDSHPNNHLRNWENSTQPQLHFPLWVTTLTFSFPAPDQDVDSICLLKRNTCLSIRVLRPRSAFEVEKTSTRWQTLMCTDQTEQSWQKSLKVIFVLLDKGILNLTYTVNVVVANSSSLLELQLKYLKNQDKSIKKKNSHGFVQLITLTSKSVNVLSLNTFVEVVTASSYHSTQVWFPSSSSGLMAQGLRLCWAANIPFHLSSTFQNMLQSVNDKQEKCGKQFKVTTSALPGVSYLPLTQWISAITDSSWHCDKSLPGFLNFYFVSSMSHL